MKLTLYVLCTVTTVRSVVLNGSQQPSLNERDPLFSTSYTKGDSFSINNGITTEQKNQSYASCTQKSENGINPSNTNNTNNTQKPSIKIKLYHIILLQIGQVFNYLQSKSYKIYSGFIHYDLGISYKILTYTVFVSGYASIINLLTSKYYNRLPCNIFISSLFMISALSAFLLYYLYTFTFIIFLSRPLLTLSTMALWNYVLSIIINCIDIKIQNCIHVMVE